MRTLKLQKSICFVLLTAAGILLASCGETPPATDPLQPQAEEQVEIVTLSLEVLRLHIGVYPPADPGLAWLRTAPPKEEIDGIWRGPYLLDSYPDVDPWGRPLHYAPTEEGSNYVLKSLGPDPDSEADDILASELLPRLHDEMTRGLGEESPER